MHKLIRNGTPADHDSRTIFIKVLAIRKKAKVAGLVFNVRCSVNYAGPKRSEHVPDTTLPPCLL